MFKNLLAVLVCSLFWMYPVNATHLGPIVFGQERVERIIACFLEEDALFIAKQEEESIIARESPEQYQKEITHLFERGNCMSQDVRYVPEETIYQWNGWLVRSGKIQEELVLFSIIKSESRDTTIYVIVADEAPAPVSK